MSTRESNGFSTIINRILTAILSALFVLVFTLTIATHAIITSVGEPATILTIFKNNNFSDRSRPLLALLFFNYSLTTGSNDSLIQDFPMDEWENIADVLFPDEWIEQALDGLIHSIWAWFGSPNENFPQISIDLTQPVEILRSRRGSLVILPLLQKVPACNSEVTSFVLTAGELPDCLPPRADLTQTSRKMAGMVANMLYPKLDYELLRSQGFINEDMLVTTKNIQLGYAILVLSRRFGLFFSVFLISLVCLLSSGKPNLIPRMLITLFITTGLFSLFFIAIIWGFMKFGWQLVITYLVVDLDANILRLFTDLGTSLSNILLQSWFYTSCLILGISIAGWLVIRGALITKGPHNFPPEIEGKPRRAVRKQFR